MYQTKLYIVKDPQIQCLKVVSFPYVGLSQFSLYYENKEKNKDEQKT